MKNIILDKNRGWPVYADFNAQDKDGSIRILCPHNSMNFEPINIKLISGEKIWISDGEIEMFGTLILRDRIWVSVPDEGGMKYVYEKASYHNKNRLKK